MQGLAEGACQVNLVLLSAYVTRHLLYEGPGALGMYKDQPPSAPHLPLFTSIT